jgi:hypothetical protein
LDPKELAAPGYYAVAIRRNGSRGDRYRRFRAPNRARESPRPGRGVFPRCMTARPTLPRVAAFYSIIHVPAADQGRLLARVGSWLKPRGVFVGNFGTGAPDNWVEE